MQDEDYYEAVKFFDRALDLDPMDAEAYLGKFLAHNKIKTLQDLKRKAINLDDNKWFRRAMEFSDDELRACLTQVKEICLANNNTQTEKDSINEFIESIFRKNFSFAPRGYKKMEVDCFLDDICEALEYINNSTGKPKLMVNDIIVKVFSYEEKGYNQIEVDSFLDEIADYYEDLLKQKGLYNEENSEIEDEEIKVSQINAAIQQKKNEITFLKSERRKLRLLDRKKKEEIDSRVAEIELKIEDLKKKQNKIRMMGGRTDDPAD